jgi:ligand-binding SRPBCC domain-containing protein
MLRQLHREQIIRAEPARVWEFFSTPRNLNELTPPSVRFQMLGDVPAKMEAGQLIAYRISPAPGVWFRWLTEIKHVREGVCFIDEQRAGPYKFWYHEHHFEPVAGGVRMTDRVSYEVGWGPAGWLAEKLWVGRQLRDIFDYRYRRTEEIFHGDRARVQGGAIS